MKINYDKEVDALYIEFQQVTDGSASYREINELISINYSKSGKVAGIEILDASKALENIKSAFNIEGYNPDEKLAFA